MAELIFVHVPKCAGNTFLQILNRVYGGSMFNSTFEVETSIPPNVKVIAGHFTARTVKDLFPLVSKATILRSPITRIISNYYFLKHSVFPVMPKSEWVYGIRDGTFSLEQYVEVPREQNVMSYYVPLDTLKDFDFIGFTEHWKRSMHFFFNKFNNGKIISVQRENVSQDKKDISEELEEKIRQLNKKDMKVYSTAWTMWKDKL